MTHRHRAFIYSFLVIIIWGVAGPVIKLTLKEVPADLFLLYRFALSGLIAVIYLTIKGIKLPSDLLILSLLFLYCVLNSSASLGFLFLGLERTSLLEMSLLSLFGPLLMMYLGYKYLKEHITKKEKIGITITFLGSLVIALEPVINQGRISGQLLGNALIILSLLSGAVSGLLVKKLMQANISPVLLANLSFVVGFITLLPFVLLTYPGLKIVTNLTNLSLPSQLGIAYMAIVSGTIAYSLNNLAQRTIELSEAALFSYLYPIISVILAVIWLGEKYTPLLIVSSLIVLGGIIIAEIKHKN